MNKTNYPERCECGDIVDEMYYPDCLSCFAKKMANKVFDERVEAEDRASTSMIPGRHYSDDEL